MLPLLATDTWPEVAEHLRSATAELFQVPFEVVSSCADAAEPFVADVYLSEPTAQLEVALSVVVGRDAMIRLAALLLGEADVEAARELFLEVANIFMGTVKTSFVARGLVFTGGLPSIGVLADSQASFDRAEVRCRLALEASTSETVEVWLRVRAKRNTTCMGRDLEEGLVVLDDICDAAGIVLVTGGSRLTRTSVERVRRLVPDALCAVSNPYA